ANVEPKVRHFNSGDALAFILSANVFRRHLTTSQRALVAAKMAMNGPESNRAILRDAPSIPQAAQELKVSPRTVVTAKEVLRTAPKREVEAIEQGKKTVATVARETKEKAAAKESHVDKIGRVIPDEILAEWQRAETVGKRLRGLAREIKNTVEQGFSGAKQDKLKDPIYAEVGNTIIAEAGSLAYTLDSIIPYALCPSCQGRLAKNCTLCRKRGWISRFLWNSPAVSKETRELIERNATS
ncbi:MAG: hypothetical protein M3410_02160, partial [Acidobacteriota bacterium]|nr:hypothetical protein [Acidobacteriota bacterium]